MTKYQRNDIVRLREAKFEELKGHMWFKDNAFAIDKVGQDGMVYLFEHDEPVAEGDVVPLPINKKQAGNIYYDPMIAASFVGPDDEIPVHRTDYSYFMEAFKKVHFEGGTTQYDKVETQKFKYVHELQHWLREQYGTDDLKIHHQMITPAEVQAQRLWQLRDKLVAAGVSSYQYLYEMANMFYLRWMTFYDEKYAEQWKELEQATDDELLEKYQKATEHIKQQTRIYSASVLSQAIVEVSKCAKKENIAEVFDMLLEENIRSKDGGATQNTTPRVIAQLLVELMQPKTGEYWYDPAAGFSGFMIEADRYLRKENNYQSLSEKEQLFQIKEALSGMEIQKEVAWIGHCNTRFHGLWCEIKTGDSLETTNYQLYDGIICEPPMPVYTLAGRSSTGKEKKNQQTAFVELILSSLSLQGGSRAAIVVPEGFLWNSSSDYKHIRTRLFSDYHVHTILRLPKGIYPGSSVSKCVLCLDNQHPRVDDQILIYDMGEEKLEQKGLRNLDMFKGFIKAYRNREPDKKSKTITLYDVRHDDYQVSFGIESQEEEQQMETPMHYLLEANKVVRDIRSLLSKMEKEVNG